MIVARAGAGRLVLRRRHGRPRPRDRRAARGPGAATGSRERAHDDDLVEARHEIGQRIDLEHRVAAFDSGAAEHAARLAADRKRTGRPVDLRDTFIAGIALAHGATLATRNTRHFEDLPAVVDPWG